MPNNYQVRIRFDIFKLDSWKPGATINIKIDQRILKSIEMSVYKKLVFLCGNPSESDDKITINEIFQHTTDSLTLEIFALSPELMGHWGINRLEIFAYKCHPTCKSCSSDNVCDSCYSNMGLKGKICNCLEGFIFKFTFIIFNKTRIEFLSNKK